MHPELFTLPGGFSIKTYGFCLMIGFLTAVWLAMRRADRVKADSDFALDLGLSYLVFGVLGARVFYVIHYWSTEFATRQNKLLAIIDITSGGLEFLGGFLGGLVATIVLCAWKRKSLRLYMDVAAPSAMWGLAIGRIGCFFNGCCFGGVCPVETTPPARAAYAVEFPFASPAHWRHWEERLVTVPAELITTTKEALQPWLVADAQLSMSVERREGPTRKFEDLKEQLKVAKAESPDSEQIKLLEKVAAAARKKAQDHEIELISLRAAQSFPSRENPHRRTSVTELQDLAGQLRSRPVYPTQLFAAGQAMLLSILLSVIFYHRKRHGVVIAWLLILYPVQRFVLEYIRADNPPDVLGLTVSQSLSLGLLAVGLVMMVALYKLFPERSPIVGLEKLREEEPRAVK